MKSSKKLKSSAAQAPNKKLSPLAWALALVLPFIIVFGLRTALVGNYYVPSGSMETTLMTGDRILVTYSEKENPERGDIVVFADKLDWLNSEYVSGTGYLVKRVIALGGDTISADTEGNVLVNGKKIDEPYIQGLTSAFDEQVIPEGKFFAMGDNRENSADSRYHITTGNQFISVSSITGKMWLRYWPLNNMGSVE
jgi:signal peptidase I